MRRIFLMLTGVVILGRAAWAVGSGAYTNQVVGTRALGMGNAFTAVADDASAVFFNPAGIGRLDGARLSIGAAPHFPESRYEDSEGQASSMNSFVPVVPNFYFTSPLGSGHLALGFGVVAPFGLETHWDKSGPFRYVTTDSRLSHIEFLPTAAWSVNDKLSVGGSVVYSRTSARLSSALNVTGMNDSFEVPSTEADGGKTVEGDGDAWGYVVSSLLAITEKDTVGLTYRSRLKTKVEGTTRLSGLAGASASVFGGADYSVDTNTELIFPDTLTLGFARRMGKITFALDAEYAGYGAVKETKLSFKGESDETRLSVLNDGNPVKRDWRNSWNMGTGVNAVLTPTLEVRGGYLYYPTVIPEENWDPSIPEAATHGFSLGGTWKAGMVDVDLSLTRFQFEKRTVSNNVGASVGESVSGTYTTHANVVSVNIGYRFGGEAGASK